MWYYQTLMSLLRIFSSKLLSKGWLIKLTRKPGIMSMNLKIESYTSSDKTQYKISTPFHFFKFSLLLIILIVHCTMCFRQWRIGIRVFGAFALILWVLRPFQAKMLLSLSNSLSFALISLIKLGKNSKNSYFSD